MLYELFTWVHDKEGILNLDRFIVGPDDLSDARALAQSLTRHERAGLYGALFARDATRQTAHAHTLGHARAFGQWLDALSSTSLDTPHSCFFYYLHYAIAHQTEWLTTENLTRFFLAWFQHTPLEANETLTALLTNPLIGDHLAIVHYALIDTHRHRITHLFEHEPHPFHSIALMKNWIADPPVFIGALLALVDKNISPEDLAHTGLLHDYFRYHLYTLSEPDNPLHLLENALVREPKGHALMAYLQSIASDERGFDQYSLLGVRSSTPPLHDIPHDYPALAFLPSADNFENLYHLFGTSFLADLFIYHINLSHPAWHRALVQQLNAKDLTAKALTDITQQIAKAAPHKLPLLASCLNEETIKSHFEKAPLAMMYLLEHHQSISALVTLCDIKRYITLRSQHHDNGPEQIQALFCFFKALSKSESEHCAAVYEALLEKCLAYPPCHEDRELLKTLKRFDHKKAIVTPLISKLEHKLTETIQHHQNSFNQIAYYDIEDTWREMTVQFNLIDEIMTHHSTFPRNKYDLIRTVAKHYFTSHRDARLDDFLEALEIECHFDALGFNLYERILIELLPSIDHIAIEQDIISRFSTHPTRQDTWYFTAYANQPLWQRAVEQGNIRLIEWLRPRLLPDHKEIHHSALKAAKAHQWPMVHHFLSLSDELTPRQQRKLLQRATKDDQVDVLVKYRAAINRSRLTELLFDIAYESQARRTLNWLLTNADVPETHIVKKFHFALVNAHWWYIDALHGLGLDTKPLLAKALSNQLTTAAMHGHIELYHHLKSFGMRSNFIHHLMTVSASTGQHHFLQQLINDHKRAVEIIMLKDSIIQAIRQRKPTTTLLLLTCIKEQAPDHLKGLLQFIIKKKWVSFLEHLCHEVDLPSPLYHFLAAFAITHHHPVLLTTLIEKIPAEGVNKLFKFAINQHQIEALSTLIPHTKDPKRLITDSLSMTDNHRQRLIHDALIEMEKTLEIKKDEPYPAARFFSPSRGESAACADSIATPTGPKR